MKGKKQPDACLTNAGLLFSFKSVSSMDRFWNVGGRRSPAFLAAAKGRGGDWQASPQAGKCGWVRQRPGDPTKLPSPLSLKGNLQREKGQWDACIHGVSPRPLTFLMILFETFLQVFVEILKSTEDSRIQSKVSIPFPPTTKNPKIKNLEFNIH